MIQTIFCHSIINFIKEGILSQLKSDRRLVFGEEFENSQLDLERMIV
jgi:hypothetical protein